jgi:predicted SAM-dependent methyltransferase
MYKVIEHNGEYYPEFQSYGNAAQFAVPFAKQVCSGVGYDIGYCKEEWKLPGAIGIDIVNGKDANNLPNNKVDYIFSSHCLEHVDHWVETLEHWISRLKYRGILFLYLPDISQSYWRPWFNKKHKHVLTPEILSTFLTDHGFVKFCISGIDLNNSFMVIAEKV